MSDQYFRETLGIKGTASDGQLARLGDAVAEQLDAGFIGIAIDPEYAPDIDYDEYVALGQVARETGVPIFTHIRYSSPEPPEKSSLLAIDEVDPGGPDLGCVGARRPHPVDGHPRDARGDGQARGRPGRRAST